MEDKNGYPAPSKSSPLDKIAYYIDLPGVCTTVPACIPEE
jgi:hypothetical protein